MLIRVWHTKVANFIQCRVYIGQSATRTMDNVGTLRIDADKWEAFKETMNHAEFVEDFAEAMYR